MLGMYSRELVVPVEGLEPTRYRKDLLELAPGRLPLCRRGVDAELATLVSSDGTESYPVLIELDLTWPRTPEAVLGEEWTAPVGVMSITGIVAVHLRSQREVAEIRARAFSNVEPDAIPLRVSPRLFENPTVQETAVVAWLSSLPPAGDVRRESFRQADAVAGALASMASLANEESLPLATLAELVSDFASNSTPDRGTEAWLERWLLRVVCPEAEPTSVDGVLLGPVITQLVSHDPLDEIVATEFLKALRPTASSDGGNSVAKALVRIAELVRGETPFTRLRPEGSAVAKALLLFLLRPSIDAIASWADDDTGATPAVLLLAAAFSGLAVGYRGLPIGARGSRALRGLISTALADRINADTGSTWRVSPKGPEPRAGVERTDRVSSLIDLASGEVLVSRELPKSDPVDHLITVEVFDATDRALALSICEHLGWTDCLEWEVVTERVLIVPAGRRVRITAPASASVSMAVIEEVFKARVQEAPRDQVLAALAADLAANKAPKKRGPSRRKPKAAESEQDQALPGIVAGEST
jgi:hypothetical protein